MIFGFGLIGFGMRATRRSTDHLQTNIRG